MIIESELLYMTSIVFFLKDGDMCGPPILPAGGTVAPRWIKYLQYIILRSWSFESF